MLAGARSTQDFAGGATSFEDPVADEELFELLLRVPNTRGTAHSFWFLRTRGVEIPRERCVLWQRRLEAELFA